ncbi:M20 family metallopeptidase [Gehongia tenuis]|uniref:Amidohydrolase n=1 Tax=Gehongia tenuis TaxID=2763655 RepID=A0A926HP44_9FIRM|nr:M20 family metallopeptidase [Gehongia tenuis]MBC8530300.1 amidohydrolase [Gehongia tenuis]
MDKQAALRVIDEQQDFVIGVSDRIWATPETNFQEKASAKTLCAALRQAGFAVEEGVADIPTAFTGTFGAGRPVIGILGEYDALSGLSQEGGCPEKKPLVEGGHGHGCGHNSLGSGSLAAAIAVKAYLEGTGKSGTVIYFGCPAEEGGSGKAYMARAGLFSGVDIALTWHPMSVNCIASGSCLANYEVAYHFSGIAAHASSAPHLGRSALDAVELMNVGCQFLREHIIPEARIHYAITNAGGISANVVQPEAEVVYLIRAPKIEEVEPIYQRVNDIAKGAALMTGTTLKARFIKGTSNTVPNGVLERVMHENFAALPLPQYTEEERAFAAKLIENFAEGRELHDTAEVYCPEFKEALRSYQAREGVSINNFLLPQVSYDTVSPGSTDVGDVSWVCPVGQVYTACSPATIALHSWAYTACGNTSFAHKGLLLAAKVMAASAIDLLENPDLVEKAQAEHRHQLGGSVYRCPIPEGVSPKLD